MDSLHVVATGTGPTVLFLPGLFGSAYGFRHLVPQVVAAGYRAVIVEPLGVGFSSRPAHADYSLASQSDRIASVLDTMRTGPVLIIAHSLGGAIAFRLAVRRPDLVRGIVSLEGGPTEEATTPGFRHAMKFAPIFRLLGAGLMRRKIRDALINSSGDASWVTDEVVHGYTEGAARDLGATYRAFKAMGHSKEPEALAPRLKEIRCPVRMIVGGAPHDGDVNPDEVTLLHHTLRSFAVDSVPGIGHYPQEERPAVVLESIRLLEAGLRGADLGAPDARRPRR